jgi:hypothetical protein
LKPASFTPLLKQTNNKIQTKQMVASIEIPNNYGYVFLTCGVLPTVTNLLLGGKVMAARKKYNV